MGGGTRICQRCVDDRVVNSIFNVVRAIAVAVVNRIKYDPLDVLIALDYLRAGQETAVNPS